MGDMVVPGAMSTEAPRAPEAMLVATTTVLAEATMAVYMACTRGQLSPATSGGTTDLDAAIRLCTGPTLATGQPSTTTKSSTPQHVSDHTRTPASGKMQNITSSFFKSKIQYLFSKKTNTYF